MGVGGGDRLPAGCPVQLAQQGPTHASPVAFLGHSGSVSGSLAFPMIFSRKRAIKKAF